MAEYLVVDIETVPLDSDSYFDEDEDGRLEFLNPIDSKVIAAGIRSNGSNEIYISEDEKQLLTDFWDEWGAVRKGNSDTKVVGFNISDFDMYFLTSRSFQNDVTVTPFLLKDLIDLRERISAFKWKPRGKLQDYAESIGISPKTGGGENVAYWYRNGEMGKIEDHLAEDLEITDEVFKKAKHLNITKIDKW